MSGDRRNIGRNFTTQQKGKGPLENIEKRGNGAASPTDFDLAWPLCPGCGEQIVLIVDHGEQHCSECGLQIILSNIG